MNDTLAGLVKAMVKSPGDDTLRMVCADWFEENGDEARAQLIRTQVEVEGVLKKNPYANRDHDHTCSCDWGQSLCTERDLLKSHGRRWLKEVYPHLQPCNPPGVGVSGGPVVDEIKSLRWMFRRGFLARVRCGVRLWVETVGDLLYHRTPLEEVWFNDPPMFFYYPVLASTIPRWNDVLNAFRAQNVELVRVIGRMDYAPVRAAFGAVWKGITFRHVGEVAGE